MFICEKTEFDKIIDMYGKLIFSVCYGMTRDYFASEDLTQDAFLSAFLNYDSFDGKNTKGWLTVIAANKCRDYLKSAASRIVPMTDDEMEINTHAAPSAEQTVLEDNVRERLRKLCLTLKEPYKSLSINFYINGLTLAEIAEKKNENLNTLQTRLYRARNMLRKLWKEEFS